MSCTVSLKQSTTHEFYVISRS